MGNSNNSRARGSSSGSSGSSALGKDLREAVRDRDLGRVKKLIADGAAINGTDEKGHTALHCGAITNQGAAIDALAPAGATGRPGTSTEAHLFTALPTGFALKLRVLCSSITRTSTRGMHVKKPRCIEPQAKPGSEVRWRWCTFC